MSDEKKTTTLSDALATLGALAGFLWGGAIGSDDPELGFWPGAIGGTIMGAVGGKVAGIAVSVAIRVAIAVLFLALIGLRMVSFANAVGG